MIYHTWQRLNWLPFSRPPLDGSSSSTCDVENAEEQDSWKIALGNKFKNARRHMTGDERLKENRQKFATKKTSTRELDDKLRRNKKAKMGGSVPITPCILYDGADLPYARNLSLHADKELMFRMSNGEERVLVLMSAHWLLNVEYARKAFNVLVTMEWLLLGQRSTSPRTPVVKLLNVFKKATK
ncbi:uncharacterized protein LOC119391117 [Rhipicephalus sanguineus]|uniref:uncharacterized protein LOC119391117 n=1 Tax=Rhipicephalus sanguineus TaxID=34632 RepID=UPI0020C5A350|nr:uncharacterized protein LOC119391117 [Rhipicephalus sanguineus]